MRKAIFIVMLGVAALCVRGAEPQVIPDGTNAAFWRAQINLAVSNLNALGVGDTGEWPQVNAVTGLFESVELTNALAIADGGTGAGTTAGVASNATDGAEATWRSELGLATNDAVVFGEVTLGSEDSPGKLTLPTPTNSPLGAGELSADGSSYPYWKSEGSSEYGGAIYFAYADQQSTIVANLIADGGLSAGVTNLGTAAEKDAGLSSGNVLPTPTNSIVAPSPEREFLVVDGSVVGTEWIYGSDARDGLSLGSSDKPSFAGVQLSAKPEMVSTGAAPVVGSVALTDGVATNATTAVTTNSLVFLTAAVEGTNSGSLYYDVNAGTNIVIHSDNAADDRTVDWMIVEPY